MTIYSKSLLLSNFVLLLLCQLVLFLGFTILVASTYVTLRTDQQADAAENIANIANEMRKQNQDGDLAPIVHDDAEDEDDDKEEGESCCTSDEYSWVAAWVFFVSVGLGLLKDPLKPMIPEEHLKEDEGAAVGGDAVNAGGFEYCSREGAVTLCFSITGMIWYESPCASC